MPRHCALDFVEITECQEFPEAVDRPARVLEIKGHVYAPDRTKASSDGPSLNRPFAAAERHTRPCRGRLMPRRRELRPRLLAAVILSIATLAFSAERKVVRQKYGSEASR